ncbi:hypothetical protein K466DRAFT_649975 [Polyporus arcularius HHB13444]|uniref:Transmembrane protein n=1 Tax=Polyporus arcularius HHB13444 TaxID=1314778 RepID=A0A5C3PUC6_9APHY|nr:hypothetical protein K466DRAFT_649975 [Polyporus arcularius HHB13444]
MISLVAVFATLLIRSSLVRSQNTTATCVAGYEWTFNSLGQSPCLITAYLWEPCYALSQDIVAKLDEGFVYQGPVSPSSSNKCLCNTVSYSTLAACAVCQGRGLAIYSWPQYRTNCSAVDEDAYPFSIAGGTAVPAWAYLDVVKNGSFNVVAAQALAETNPPESTAPALSSTLGTSSVTATFSTTGSPPTLSSSSSGSSSSPTGQPTSPSSSSSSSSSHTNVGAIVGGVIGGIGAALIIGAAIFFALRRRNRAPPSSHFTRSPAMAENAPFVGGDPFMTPTPGSLPEVAPVLYDPNDPRTFPSPTTYHDSSVGTQSLQVRSAHTAYGHDGSISTSSNPTFTGRPEL